MRRLIPILAAAVAALPAGVRAQTQVLHVGDRLARFDMLQPSVRRYLRYKVVSGHREILDIWTREVRFEAEDGERRLHILQEWDGAGADPYVLHVDAWFEPGTFRPLTYVKTVSRGGKTQVGGYRFLPDRIVGLDDLPGNVRKGFSQPSPEPAYNFETDMEFLEALPLAAGYSVNINFYDPGLEPPARYTFKVADSDAIRAADGRLIDCWVVTADYNDPKAVPTRFWFAKKDQVLVREESRLPDGALLVKTLLNDEATLPERRAG